MTVFKCQTIIALSKGISMSQVCNVMNVTRETVRIVIFSCICPEKKDHKSKLTSAPSRHLCWYFFWDRWLPADSRKLINLTV